MLEEFLRHHRILVISSVYLVACLLVAGYAFFYRNLAVGIQDLRIVTSRLEKENKRLKEIVERQAKRKEEKKGITSMPDFLARINGLANAHKVIIRKLSPDNENKFKFNIEMMADYETILKFTADLESLDTILNDLQIRPYNSTAVPPIHFVTFSLTPRGNADPLQSERLAALRGLVEKTGKRNPFQRHAPGEQAIELTWLHKLSGVGRDHDGRIANIDRHDYREGDMLDDKTVTKIEDDRVFFEKKGQRGSPTQRYVLKTRPPQQ
jgi:hypothetical protein